MNVLVKRFAPPFLSFCLFSIFKKGTCSVFFHVLWRLGFGSLFPDFHLNIGLVPSNVRASSDVVVKNTGKEKGFICEGVWSVLGRRLGVRFWKAEPTVSVKYNWRKTERGGEPVCYSHN